LRGGEVPAAARACPRDGGVGAFIRARGLALTHLNRRPRPSGIDFGVWPDAVLPATHSADALERDIMKRRGRQLT